MNRFTVLGCGASQGVPAMRLGHPGGFWGSCDPNNPKNRRTRTSLYVIYDGLHLLIDSSPDLRTQWMDQKLNHIDGVLYSHAHSDQAHGIDELRYFFLERSRKPLPIYGSHETLEQLQASFAYLFTGSENGLYPAVLTPHPIAGTFQINGVTIQSFTQEHGKIKTLGYRFGPFAYSTDFNNLDEAALAALAGVETWIVDCVSLEGPRPSHCHLELSLDWIERVNPKQAILTHMGTTLDYEDLRKRLPPHVIPAYDGLTGTF